MMAYKISSAKISAALIREDFKRFWALPMLAFFVYIFSCISALELCNNKVSYSETIREILECRYVAVSILLILIPILAVMLVFSYMNISGKVMAAHSQPFTRTAMINSHALSVFLMCILPVIATGLVFLIIAHPVYYPEDSSENLFARIYVLRWIGEMILTEIYIISISVFAVMITGTAVHNLIAILGLNALMPLLMIYIHSYLEIVLYGYSFDEAAKNSEFLHKILSFYDNGISIKNDIVYLVISVIIYIAAVMLYKRRKLERTSEGIVFRSLEYVLTVLFGLAGAVPLGILFYEVTCSRMAGIIGFAVGSLICLLICRMIIMKTLKVFSRKTLRIAVIYAALSAVVVGASAMDICGYEDKVPETADAVRIQLDLTGNQIFRYSNDGIIEFKGDDMETAIALHKMIIDRKDDWKDYDEGYSIRGLTPSQFEDQGPVLNVRFCYVNEKKKKAIYRGYNIPRNAVLASDEFEKMFVSSEFKEEVSGGTFKNMNIVNASLFDAYDYDVVGNVSITDQGKLDELKKALIADYKTLDFENFIRSQGKECGIMLYIDYRDKKADLEKAFSFSNTEDREKWIYVSGSFVNTRKWIAENICDPDEAAAESIGRIDKALVYRIKDGHIEGNEHSGDVWYEQSDSAVKNAYMVIDAKPVLLELYNASTGVADRKHADSEKNGMYYIEFLDYNSEWKQIYSSEPYNVLFKGYIKADILEVISDTAENQNR